METMKTIIFSIVGILFVIFAIVCWYSWKDGGRQ